jgi:hypothetical protein
MLATTGIATRLPYGAAVEQTAATPRKQLEFLLRQGDALWARTLVITSYGNYGDITQN